MFKLSIPSEWVAVAILIVSTNLAYSNTNTEKIAADYQELCKIYGEIAKKSMQPAEKETRIAQSIQQKIPKLIENFGRISLSDQEDKYKHFKRIAEK